MIDKSKKYLVIGAGPAGLAAARNLQKENIDFEGLDLADGVGGLWNIKSPRSTMYNSAHLISSKRMTEFKEFPMDDDVADYPHHSDVLRYFESYAKKFDLEKFYRFGVSVEKMDKVDGLWQVKTSDGEEALFKGVIICVGTLSEPNIVNYPGQFDGEVIHSANYKDPSIFRDKKVLIVGAGNSGCDIVVDAVHHAKKSDLSVRRGYHFVPKFIFGRPADTLGQKQSFLPHRIKKSINKVFVKMLTGKPQQFGFPTPDHDLFESHPIVNSLVLHHIGHGDIKVRSNIEKLEGKFVHFKDGSKGEYDLIVNATGYKVHFPFVDKKYLNWEGYVPELYLNIFHPEDDSLMILGMVEAIGIGWQGRHDMGSLVAKYLKAKDKETMAFKSFKKRRHENNVNLAGPVNYLKLNRMAYYVHKDTYLNIVHKEINALSV